MALPAEVGYCKVSGEFIRAVLDGADADRLPDGIPVPGLTIVIESPLSPSLVRTTGTKPKTIILDPIQLTTNDDGIVVDSRGIPDAYLVGSDDPDIEPSGWTYTAKISGPTLPETIRFSFAAPSGGEVDLTTVVRVPSSPGSELRAWQTAVSQTQAALAATEAARDAAIAAGATPEQVTAIVAAYIAEHPPTIGDVGGLQAALDGKLTAADLAPYVTSTALTNALTPYATTAALTSTATASRDRANHTGTQTSATVSDFTEAVQDAVAALLGAGTNITLNYNDAGNTLTVSSAGGALDVEAVRDAIGVALIGVGNISIGVNDAADTITLSTTATVNATDAALRDRSTHTGTQTWATISDGLEQVQDAVSAMFIMGNAGITRAYDDVAGTLTLTFSLEFLQDSVSTMITEGTGIVKSYDDPNGKLTLSTTGTQYLDVYRDTGGTGNWPATRPVVPAGTYVRPVGLGPEPTWMVKFDIFRKTSAAIG